MRDSRTSEPGPAGSAAARAAGVLTGLALWGAALAGVIAAGSGGAAVGAVLGAGLGAALAAWSLGRKAPGLGYTAERTPPPAAPVSPAGKNAASSAAKAPAGAASPAPGPLDPLDRERLVEWVGEPIAILRAAAERGDLTGFNQARACPGMSQIGAWRRSRGPDHPEADKLLATVEEAVLNALLEAAEYFSPIVEAMTRRGEELPPDFARSEKRIVETRRQTIALLEETRRRLANLPVTSQESFRFDDAGA